MYRIIYFLTSRQGDKIAANKSGVDRGTREVIVMVWPHPLGGLGEASLVFAAFHPARIYRMPLLNAVRVSGPVCMGVGVGEEEREVGWVGDEGRMLEEEEREVQKRRKRRWKILRTERKMHEKRIHEKESRKMWNKTNKKRDCGEEEDDKIKCER